MARQKVEQIQCDRCKRVQLLPIRDGDKPPDFQAEMSGQKGRIVLTFPDLCSYCKEALENLWAVMKEWNRPIKQAFGPITDPNTAAPVTPAPNYSPPQPHSAAAAKR